MQSEGFGYQTPSTTYAVPRRHRKASLVVGICLVILAMVSIVVGGCGFIDFYSWMDNGSVFTGHDLWIGLFYLITGTLAIIAHRGGDRPHLIRSYYAFTIISFILSFVQFGLSLGYIFGGYYYPIWQNIVSSILAVFGSSFTLVCLIILSRGIFCTSPQLTVPTYTPYAPTYGTIINNGQVVPTYGTITNNGQVIPQQIPQAVVQPAVLGNQQPTIFQSLDGRQFYVAVPTTGVIPPQMTSPTNAIVQPQPTAAVQPQPPNYATTNTNKDCKAEFLI